ncbi:MAG: T9SS type A sorting domain-containing protein [Bacteroidia bacterium]|nr:T9SS type A sorting domain-containing protein [Bacteroidia bacterium]
MLIHSGCKVIIFILLLKAIPSAAQKEANIWYFGLNNGYGLDFNHAIPEVLTNGKQNTSWGTACISNAAGRLMFYTDGDNIWDSTQQIMPNGKGLKGWGYDGRYVSSYQGKLIIPQPDSNYKYFLFITDIKGRKNGLMYSQIDMRLNSGRGDIVTGEKCKILTSPVCEGLAGVRHSNGKDVWLLTLKFNSDSLLAYLVTSKGISSKPVKSFINNSVSFMDSVIEANVNIKISPNGKKIYVSQPADSSFLADFNASTGLISNVWRFSNLNDSIGNIEFSPKSKYLYSYSSDNTTLKQFDLRYTSKSSFLSSKKTINKVIVPSGGGFFSYLQLGTDAKIYLADLLNYPNYIQVIHAPDSLGTKCRFQNDYIEFPGKLNTQSLPNFVSSFFWNNSYSVFNNCSNDTAIFTLNDPEYRKDSVLWIFGDSLSGALNTSKKLNNVKHFYRTPGKYLVSLIYYYNNIIDTVRKVIYIKNVAPNLGNDTSYCGSFGLLLKPKRNYLSYQWNTGDKNSAIFVFSKGTYWLRALDSLGCWSNDTIIIKNPRITPSFSINDSSQCLKGNVFNCFDNTKFHDDNRFQTFWRFSDGVTINDSVASKSFSNSGNYTITLVAHSKIGCVDSITRKIQVFEQSQIGFKINQTQQCFNKQSFDFFNTSYSNDSLTFHWDLGDLNTSQKHYFNKQYIKTGNYSVRLVTLSDKGCSDTLNKSINILPAPRADFNWGVVCDKSTSSFNFTGTVPSSPTITSYSWQFPSDSSNQKNPKVLLSQTGINKVRLSLKSDNGCSDQIIKDIDVKPQATADFEAFDVCEDSIANFINKTHISSGIVTYKWFFGDGNSSSIENPKHNYVINGFTKTFNVKLTANIQNGCSDSVIKAITINAKPKQGFTYSVNNLTVNFLANEANGIKYHWTFGDGTTTIINKKDYQYTYSKFPSGKYKACLEVTNLADCKSDTCIDIQFSGTIHSLKRNSIILYPNPNSGRFTLELHKPNSTIEIFNSIGQKMYYFNITEIKTELNFELENGVYLFRISNGEEVLNQKIIVKK